MARTSLGKLDTRQPVAVDLTKVHDITARMNTPAALPQMSADFIAPINIPQPKAWRPNALAVLDGVLGGGMTFTESRRAEEDRHRTELAMPQMEALKTRLLTELGKAGPDELKAYLTNPGEFGKNIATRLAASDLAAGSSRVYGNPDQGGSVYTAPKTDTAAGQAFSYGPEGVKALGAVPFVPEYQTLAEGGKAIPKMPILPPGFGGPAALAASLPQVGEVRPVATAPLPTEVAQRIRSTATALGAAPAEMSYLERLAQIESAGNPAARNGSSTGVFQFQPATFATVGGGDINSVEDQTKAALRLATQDRRKLVELGIEPTDANLYIMHQQGAGGGPALLTAPPEVNAVAALAPAYGGDANKARRAIVGNGGTADMTAGEFTDMWRRKWGGSAAPVSRASPSGGDPAGTVYGREKPQPRQMTAEERITWKIPEGVPAVMKADGTPDVISLPGGQSSPRKAEADLRKEFNLRPEVKEFRDVSNSYRVIQRLAGQDTAAGDMSMIFAFMKMLDPGSVVREGEFANAQNSAGIPDRVVNAYNKALSGTRLAPKQRADFLGQARNIFDTRSDRFGQIAQEYRGYAADYDLDPDRITTLGEPEAAPGPAREKGWSKALPAPQVEAAKRFKGTKAPAGDPTNPFVPRNAAEFKNIPPGKSYIDDDGSVQVKR